MHRPARTRAVAAARLRESSSHDAVCAIGQLAKPRRGVVVTALGLGQIIAWGSSYYLPAVLAKPIAQDTGWPLSWVVGGLSLALLAAGLISPSVGRAIERRAGRGVMASSAVLLAAGLIGVALAHSIAVYVAAWLVMGLGMGMGLYDAAFATLGRLYGQDARQAITTLTLFGGFASTACWPLSAFFVSALGWRGACVGYAALHLLLVLPLYLATLPPHGEADASGSATHRDTSTLGSLASRAARSMFILLAAVITIASAISAVVSVHLLSILQDRGLALAAAVAMGALVGPAQVAARAIEMFIGRFHHPIWTMVASTVLMAAGLGMLSVGVPIVAAALVVYGAGLGIQSISRGTLPLALFGAGDYAVLMGRLAMPSLVAQALSPSLGAVLMERLGSNTTTAVLFSAAIVNLALTLLMVVWSRPARPRSKG